MTATQAQLAEFGLIPMGQTYDQVEGQDSLIQLIGAGREFWAIFEQSPEYSDGQTHPLDRWSERILGYLQLQTEAAAVVFPFGGPPYAPFLRWASQTEEAWQSPVGMLVHKGVGMMISFRGALVFPAPTSCPTKASPSPCRTCQTAPCATACPVGALTAHANYDVDRCKSFLMTNEGADCMANGCKARRSCPISQSFDRPLAQSAFHMAAFMPVQQDGS